jgi:predicted transcriptional regulator
MPVRRSKLDIMLDVLSAVQNGEEKPTRIMYSANLSWKPTRKILGILVDQGLLRDIEVTGSKRSKRSYVITEKGVNVLRYFDGAREI